MARTFEGLILKYFRFFDSQVRIAVLFLLLLVKDSVIICDKTIQKCLFIFVKRSFKDFRISSAKRVSPDSKNTVFALFTTDLSLTFLIVIDIWIILIFRDTYLLLF